MKVKFKIHPSLPQRRQIQKTMDATQQVLKVLVSDSKRNKKNWESDNVIKSFLASSVVLKERAVHPVKYLDIELRTLECLKQMFLDEQYDSLENIFLKTKECYFTDSPLIRVLNGQIYLPRVGWIPIEIDRGIKITQVSQVTVSKEDDEWFVIIKTNF